MLEMVKAAEYDLLHYPERKMGYGLKRTIKILTGRKVEPPDKINWPNKRTGRLLYAAQKFRGSKGDRGLP